MNKFKLINNNKKILLMNILNIIKNNNIRLNNIQKAYNQSK